MSELETLRREVRALSDRQAVADLIDRLGLWLDEKRFAEARSILAADVRVRTPGGTADGIDRVVAQAARNHQERTQHVISNVRVDVDGDRATAGANLLVTFAGEDGAVRVAQGERYAFQAVREPEGWRLASIAVTPVWATG
jgi:3-phenylpropionate/cinnamic acid dioxygenase small subunit